MNEASRSETALLDEGTLTFSIESRLLRELGERLVKQPSVAIVELIKNAYDADATECTVIYEEGDFIAVVDDGVGMTMDQFTNGWMRIGTSAKEAIDFSSKYFRLITGEKGIGRFAVRFLGKDLHLESVAWDLVRRARTRVTADFDWPQFDKNEDIGKIAVPYRLESVPEGVPTGTKLRITRLRDQVANFDFRRVQTASIGILTPLRSLLRASDWAQDETSNDPQPIDPGFILNIQHNGDLDDGDVAARILDGFVLRARLLLHDNKLELSVFRRGGNKPYLEIVDTYPNAIGNLQADVRFFPRRTGAFRDLPVDGRRAQKWIHDNQGVAVFDRGFRVQPYGAADNDDWLQLQADAARNRRDPRSNLARRHFAMSDQERGSTSENWMLRLPQSAQLIGVVQVQGRRNIQLNAADEAEGLIASADREGFVENEAFGQLRDLVRGAVEAIAYADRRIQQAEERDRQEKLFASIRDKTNLAITEIRANRDISSRDKSRIVAALAESLEHAERHEDYAREREQQLEVMSLLGVVAGFMTHEFGVALKELEEAKGALEELAKAELQFAPLVQTFEQHIGRLRDFVDYASGYTRGARSRPTKAYPVRPRLKQVVRVFGKYAEERNISVEISVDSELDAPLVPVSLYNGIALNLYTNALKAVTAKAGARAGTIAFRAWNEGGWHFLEVSDTGIGIPSALQERVFDPLFTTTQSRNDPLGSGMGLGLALVRRGAKAFGGDVDFVSPPPGFATCVRVKLPDNKGAFH